VSALEDRALALAVLAALAGLFGCEDPFFVLYDGGALDASPGTDDATAEEACRAFAFHQIPYGPDAGSSAVARFSPAEAWLSTQASGAPWYRVGKSLELASDPNPAPDFVAVSAFRRDDVLWLGGADGRLARSTVGARAIDPIATASTGDGLRFLGGSDTGDFELFALSDHNVLYRFDGARFERLWTGTSTREVYRSHGGVAWAGPHDVYAVPVNSTCNDNRYCVLHYHESDPGRFRVEEELYPLHGTPAEPDYATTVAFIPDIGPILGTFNGWAIRRTVSGWIEFDYLMMFTDAPEIRAIIPYRHGFMSFSERHALQWAIGPGGCGQVNLFHEEVQERRIVQVNAAVAVEGAIVAVADAYADGPGFVVVLEEVSR
jgi:hypothetical protein